LGFEEVNPMLFLIAVTFYRIKFKFHSIFIIPFIYEVNIFLGMIFDIHFLRGIRRRTADNLLEIDAIDAMVSAPWRRQD
jgi:hypothetical protein